MKSTAGFSLAVLALIGDTKAISHARQIYLPISSAQAPEPTKPVEKSKATAKKEMTADDIGDQTNASDKYDKYDHLEGKDHHDAVNAEQDE
jgi:hypothetical protein